MTFDEFAAEVSRLAGGAACGAEFGKGFNGLPDKWRACIVGPSDVVTWTEGYLEPTAAIAEFAGVVELVRMRAETWLLKQRIGKLEREVVSLEQP